MRLVVLLIGILLSINSFSQIRMGSCSPSSDRNTVYLTIYTGYGFGNYRLTNTSFPNVFNDNLRQFDFGGSIHLKLNNSKIGLGADYNLFKNDFEDLNIEKNRTLFYNLYLSYEYLMYSDLFFDFGFYAGLGYPIVGEIYGDNKLRNTPINLHTGLFANFILNSYSSIILRYKFNLFLIDNTLLLNNQQHQLRANLLEVGFRTWFNF